jgi:hypothetical protein
VQAAADVRNSQVAEQRVMAMGPPERTVRVTTKEELDAALTTADQITVEGDDELLSYAVYRASRDPANQVDFVLGGTVRPTSLPKESNASIVIAAVPARQARERRKAAEEAHLDIPTIHRGQTENQRNTEEDARLDKPAFIRRESRFGIIRFAIAGTLAGLLVIGGVIGWYFHKGQSAQSNLPHALAPSGDVTNGPGQANDLVGSNGYLPHLRNSSDVWANLPSILWPLVAIIAIVALFLIARQAISNGSNVTISWKVTEKVSGRVVITKVRERAPRQRAAA